MANEFEPDGPARSDGDPGPFPLLECGIGIAGEDLAAIAAVINALSLKQAVDAAEREPLLKRRAMSRQRGRSCSPVASS
jgi:hypothetical protein